MTVITGDYAVVTKLLLEGILDFAVFMIDTDGKVASWNAGAERIKGYQPDQIIGQPYETFFIPEDRADALPAKILHTAQTQGRYEGEGWRVRKDGSRFYAHVLVNAVHDERGRFVGYAKMTRDITAAMVTERELVLSRDRFRTLVENISDYAILWLDVDGCITSWNFGAQSINGWTADEVTGKHFRLFYSESDQRLGLPELGLRTAAHEGRYEWEGWHIRKDGSRFWANAIIDAIHDAGGNLQGFAKIVRDRSDAWEAEQTLRRVNVELEQRVQERTAELQAQNTLLVAARAMAETANRAKTNFLASASHDLRQPVQSLAFFSGARASKLHGHALEPVVAHMGEAVEALKALLDRLLDISRLDAGVVPTDKTSFPLGIILERLQTEYAPQAAAAGLRLRLARTSLWVNSDSSLLERILRNFIENALRYTRHGGVVIGCRRRGRDAALQVVDSGIGIPADRIPEIFDEFTQLSNPERNRRQGFGLGLAIVRRLADLVGSPVEVKSVPGRGSSFTLLLPMVASMRERKAAPAAEIRGRGLVLVIDDEAIILAGIKMLLETNGYHVLTATSEAEAVSLLAERDENPRIIIADYRLRDGKTGVEALHSIIGRVPEGIYGIVLTGDTAPERIIEARASGFALLHKPISPPELFAAMEKRR